MHRGFRGFLYVLLGVALLALAVAVHGKRAAPVPRKQVLIYYGILCETGRSALGLPSVTCRPRFGNGYTTVMARRSLMLLRNGNVLWVRPNR